MPAPRNIASNSAVARHDTFGGLRLDVDPLELAFNGALDLMNVGGVEVLLPRPGFQRWHANATDLGSAISWLWAVDSVNPIVVFGNTVRMLSGNDGSTVTSTALTTPVTGAVKYAGNWYVCSGAAGDTVRINSGASWAAAAGAPKCLLLDRTPWDNRLVAISTATASRRIEFSGPDAPTTWGDYVEPEPFARGVPTASARWRELLFVFGARLFVVFTGTTTNQVGAAEFDHRTVDYGVGAIGLHAACAAPEGVYFMAHDGIYLTAGGPAARVSDAIGGLWTAETPVEFTAFGSAAHMQINFNAPISMAFGHDNLYIAVTSVGTGQRVLIVYDTKAKTWELWSIGGIAVATPDPANEAALDTSDPSKKSGVWVAGPTDPSGTVDNDSVWRMIPR